MVEKQDAVTGEWIPVSSYVRGTEFNVPNLDEGKRYKFRVKAVNESGASEPLESDAPITAENPVGMLVLYAYAAYFSVSLDYSTHEQRPEYQVYVF